MSLINAGVGGSTIFALLNSTARGNSLFRLWKTFLAHRICGTFCSFLSWLSDHLVLFVSLETSCNIYGQDSDVRIHLLPR